MNHSHRNIVVLMVVSIFLAISSCKTSNKTEEVDKNSTKKIYEPNLDKRVKAYQGQLYDKVREKDKGGGGSFDFAISNIMWRASLLTLKDIPLVSVDYGAGIIITDWYSYGTRESIKININFNSNVVAVSSIDVTAFKKTCNDKNECTISKTNDSFTKSIKDNIVNKIREIKNQELNKKG